MDEPAGFGIRYIWSAQADGPALQSGIKSKDYITPYRPIIVSTPGLFIEYYDISILTLCLDKEWVYKTTVTKEKKALVEVQAKLDKQTYCPGTEEIGIRKQMSHYL